MAKQDAAVPQHKRMAMGEKVNGQTAPTKAPTPAKGSKK